MSPPATAVGCVLADDLRAGGDILASQAYNAKATSMIDASNGFKIPYIYRASLRIVSGDLRGAHWLPASGGKTLRIFLGTYERPQTSMFQKSIGCGDVVFDIGASLGYYTLLSSRLVGRPGRVVAFEPDPRNVAFLRRHVWINRAFNTTVHQAAIGNCDGAGRFSTGTGTGTGRLDERGKIPVRLHRLDDIVADEACQPTHLKIDVEGAELQVLQGAQATLRKYRPIIFLSTHGSRKHASCCQLLAEMNYRMDAIAGGDVATASELVCRAA